MPALKDDIKLFIVQSLACYDTPTQVVELVKEEFGVTIERSHIQVYDPTKRAGKDLGKKFVEVFDATRKAFLEDISKIPIANKSFRLRALQRSYDWFVSKSNYIAANQVLEQAAKEVGGFYTNKVKVGGDADNPFLEFYNKISGGSIPIVQDVEGEAIENEVIETVEVKKPIKKVMIGAINGRD